MLRLLQLEGEDVVRIAALQQEHPGEQTHAAYADHLVTQIDDLVALEEGTTIRRQALEIARQGAGDEGPRHGVFGHPHEQWWLIDEFTAAIHNGGELAHRGPCRASLSLGDRATHRLLPDLAARALTPGLHRGGIDTVVPDVDLRHGGVLRHGPPILPCAGQRRVSNHILGKAVVAGREHERGGQALDIPFEWPGIGLIEVVDIEDRHAIRCGEETEVRQVSVAAELDLKPARRLSSEVAGHDDRGSPIEGEGTRPHALVTQGEEGGDARLLLLLQQGDRVRTIGGGLVDALNLAGHRLTGCLAIRRALGRGEVGAEGEIDLGFGLRGHARSVRPAAMSPGAVVRCGSSGVTSRRMAPRQPVALRTERSTWSAVRHASAATAGSTGPGP